MVEREVRTALIDLYLEDIDGVVRWYENVRGEMATCMLDARHLSRVLRARAIYAEPPKLKRTVPVLRLFKGKEKTA